MLCSLALSLFLFTPFAAPLPQSSTNALSLPPPLCKSSSSPNPIAAQYPQNVTGTINGTILVVPIPLTLARTIIPAQYPILTQSYQSLLPTFPKDQYPMFLEGLLDHDIRSTGGQSLVADFTRISFSFPFVDRLNDGRTTFRTTSTQLLSANPIAVAGSNLYSPGQGLAGTFDPPCEGYAFQAGQTVDGKPVRHQTAWNGLDQLLGKPPSWDVRMVDVASQPYPQTFLGNITNQPSFGTAPVICDNYIEYFNTSISKGAFAPVPVKANITVRPPFFPSKETFRDVYGVRVDRAFLENNAVTCSSLKDYPGPGAGEMG